MKLRNKLTFMVMSVMFVFIFTGCGNNIARKDSDKIKVVCTIFPQYDWVREIVGDTDNIELNLLIDNGVDLHSYQPTADDIITISDCDVFIYVGGESDAWVESTLAQASNKDMIVINMMEVLGDSVKEEEVIEGMDKDGDHDDDTDHKDVDEIEYDEHVWLSLKNTITICKNITAVLCEEDSENQDTYKCNQDAYIQKLNNLDDAYKETVADAKYDTVLFGDRFPFRYMVNDYDLNYYAAFVGCSAETEASFETVTFLAGKLNELDLNTVLVVEGSNQSLAGTIISSSEKKNQTILVMNSMQSVTEKDIENGVTYIDIMEKNLNVLKQALESGM